MSWFEAAAAVVSASQARAAGKYNQAVAERNAKIKEQEAAQAQKQLEFDLARFDQQFEQLEGQTRVASLKSGVELSGSALKIQRYNTEQSEIQKDIMEYNSKVEQARKIEEANFARIQGQVAKMESRQAMFGYLGKAGSSLLKTYGSPF